VSRLRRGITIGAALLFFGTPADGASAAPDDPMTPGAQADDRRADEAQQRPTNSVEPRGNPASPAAMRAGRLRCGDVITRNTTLVADIGPCPADGIIIGANNIRLNLNGHTVSGAPGPGSGNDAGIRLPFRTGVTITGRPGNSGHTGTVTGFDAGVFLNGGSANTIENLVVSDNIGPDGSEEPLLADGIVLFHSGGNRIVNNLLTHNGPYDGIGVLGVDSNDNLIEGNTVEDTVGSAGEDVIIDGVGILMNNFLDEAGTPRRGEPIRNNDVIDNVVRRSDNSGISNVTNVGARIVGNTVQDNGQRGERCFDSFFGYFCQLGAQASNGIGVTAGPVAPRVTQILIEGNTVTGNTGDGIFIDTEENRIVGNTALGNGGSDGRFDLLDINFEPPCDSNVWLDNVFGTAGPLCATGGLGVFEGPEGDPTCSDGVDNNLNGRIDDADLSCQPVQVGPR
jgi:parallel beta-helix repeat protein